ncbi:MAG: aspartyl protease family protein [Acidobacteriota bacterium]|nr:aspartyl protease family protein [Acidobacteriota bacterium]
MKNLSRVLIVVGVVAITCALWGGGAALASGGEKQLARAHRAVRQGEFEAAEKLYRELIAKDPQDLQARLGLSFALLKQRKLQDAFDAAARVIAVDPTLPRAHALLGAALLAGGDFALSVEEFKTALSFNGDEALAIAGLAMIDFHENRPSLALAGLRRAMHIDPNEPDYLFNFAKAAARSERYREAADAYEVFLRIAPKTDADRRAYIRGLIDFLRYLGTQRQLYDANGAARVQIPFEIVNNRPVINIRINHSKETLRFVIDTGSGMCVVSEEAAKRIGLRSVARGGTARAVGGGGRFDIVYGFLSSLHMGEARVENVPIYIRHFHSTQEQIDGYVGLSILAKYLATMDYGTRTLFIDRDARLAVPSIEPLSTTAQPAPANVIELPIRSTANGIWCGVVKLAGVEKPQHFIIDTGATITVVSEALSKRETLERFVQKRRLKVYGAAGVAEDVPLLLLPRVAVGPYAYQNLSAAVLDMEAINETSGFEQSGILGGNILRFFRVTFDFARGVLRLEPLLNSPVIPVADASLEPINTTPQF